MPVAPLAEGTRGVSVREAPRRKQIEHPQADEQTDCNLASHGLSFRVKTFAWVGPYRREENDRNSSMGSHEQPLALQLDTAARSKKSARRSGKCRFTTSIDFLKRGNSGADFMRAVTSEFGLSSLPLKCGPFPETKAQEMAGGARRGIVKRFNDCAQRARTKPTAVLK